MRLALPLLFIAAPVLFTFGIMLPLVRFEKLYFFSDNPSLLVIVRSLYDSGDIALTLLVALVSVLFPFVKLVAIASEALALPDGRRGWLASLVPFLTKWSMMDVLLVAIVIVAAKTSGLASAFTEPGLWCYAGSALATSAVHWMVTRRKAEKP